MLRLTRVALLAVLLLAPVAMQAGETRLAAHDLWQQATAAVDTGDLDGASKRLTSILDDAKRNGIRRFPLYAQSAASLARQLQKDKNAAGMKWASDAATRLDPQSAAVAFTLADVAMARSDWGGAASFVFSGFVNMFGDYLTRVLAFANLLIVLMATLALAAVIFAIVLFLRYSRGAAHDFREMLGTRMSGGVTAVIAFALLALPIFLWLGPLWVAIYWLVLFFPYATTRERVLSIVALLILAVTPVVFAWVAYRISTSQTPIVQAAYLSEAHAYNPETLRDLRAIVDAAPREGRLHLLLGDLTLQEGDDQEALSQYRKAIELNDKLAGAHLNMGNVHFLEGEYPAAMSEYMKAQESDSSMAIAYYNSSVASGEMYKFDQQGQQIELARQKDRTLIDHILATPPAQKIVMYSFPIDDAWSLARKLSGKDKPPEMYGSFELFDPAGTLLNPTTIGSLVAILLAAALYFKRRGKVAGSCIKCGRTFCYRCKSSKESATYCTQCIHIYLKRDGVSLDTKRSKLDEVQQYQSTRVRVNKIFTTLFPGGAHLLDGATLKGISFVALFVFFVLFAIFAGRLAPVAFPASSMRLVVRSVAIVIALAIWLSVSIPAYRQRSVSS